MSKRIFLRILIPVIGLLIINYLFFYPIFQGKILEQDDMIQGDMISKQADDYYKKNKKVLLWTDALFSGMPAIQVGIRYPKNLLTYIHKTMGAALGKPSNIYIIALLMIGFFFALYSQKVDPWLAMVGAIAFGFSTFFIVSFGAGHNAKVRTAAYIAPLLAGVLLAYRGKKWLGWSVVALVMGLSIFSNHLQVTYYTAFTILFLVFTEGIFALKEKRAKQWMGISAGLLLAAIIGVGPNISRLYTNYDYSKETMRGGISELSAKKEKSSGGLEYDYAMSWSYAPLETFNLIYTNFSGGGTNQNYEGTITHERYFNGIKSNMMQQGMPAKQAEKQANRTIASLFYWGEQTMVGGGYYLGAVVFFLFVLAMFMLGTKERIWIGLSILFALLLAWGKHLEAFSYFMFENFPLYNKFRVPSMALVSLFVLLPLAGWLALQKVYSIDKPRKEILLHLRNALFVTGGLSLVFILFAGLIDVSSLRDENFASQGVDIDQLMEDRTALIRKSGLKTLMFCLFTAGLLFAYIKKYIQKHWMVIGLLALVLFDQMPFVRQHLSLDKFVTEREYNQAFAKTAADEQILGREKTLHYRVYNTTRGITGDALTSYHHKSIGGYHGAKLDRYQDLIDHQLSKQNHEMFNMLNTRYFIVQGDNGQPQARSNPTTCGNAWFMQNINIVPNADAEMEALSDIKACKEVVADKRFSDYLKDAYPAAPESAIELTKYDPMHLVYQAVNTGEVPGLVVFSEIYYEGGGNDWIAKIDGKEVEHIRVNYLLRALKVPPGEHKIEFIFEPPSFYKGEQYALIFSFVLFGFVGFGIFKHVKEERKD